MTREHQTNGPGGSHLEDQADHRGQADGPDRNNSHQQAGSHRADRSHRLGRTRRAGRAGDTGHADHSAHADHSGRGGRLGLAAGLAGHDWRSSATRYALLPLRVFLGVTFVYAGLDKLTTSGFFASSGTDSIGEMMRSVRDVSAVPWLVDLALKAPAGFGYAIAIGEVAVGLGTLFGVLARLAALGGALISLSLWLTVSWQTEPYYYGNDLAYLMAWLPLILGGAPVLSADAELSRRRRARHNPRPAD